MKRIKKGSLNHFYYYFYCLSHIISNDAKPLIILPGQSTTNTQWSASYKFSSSNYQRQCKTKKMADSSISLMATTLCIIALLVIFICIEPSMALTLVDSGRNPHDSDRIYCTGLFHCSCLPGPSNN